MEMEARLSAGNRVTGALRYILTSKNVSFEIKKRVYRTMTRPAATYAYQTWCLTKKQEEMVERLDRPVLRTIYWGGKRGIWVRRTDKEIRQLFGEPSILTAAI